MLHDVLALVEEAQGKPLTAALIAGRLGLAPEVVRHMLRLLVQRGRLLEVVGRCDGCDVCPLHRFCAGANGGPVCGFVMKVRVRAGGGAERAGSLS